LASSHTRGGGALQDTARAAGRRPLRWQFLADTYGELRRVTWPTREEAVRLTGIVIAVSLAVGALLGAIDFVFTIVVNRLFLGVQV
jgi:preprotein translocase subunit SecE